MLMTKSYAMSASSQISAVTLAAAHPMLAESPWKSSSELAASFWPDGAQACAMNSTASQATGSQDMSVDEQLEALASGSVNWCLDSQPDFAGDVGLG